MPLIDWNDTLSVGYRPIDAEHMRLAELVNEFHGDLLAGSSMTLIEAGFQRIIRHAADHFRHEERLMEESGFPDSHNHRLAHQQLEAQIADLLTQIEAGEPVFTLELVEFLKNWLLNHILTMDKKLGEHLARRTAGTPR